MELKIALENFLDGANLHKISTFGRGPNGAPRQEFAKANSPLVC